MAVAVADLDGSEARHLSFCAFYQLQVLLSYLVSRLSGKSSIVHGVNIQVNVTTVDLNFSTAMDRHVLNSKTTPQAARGCGIRR